MAFGIDFPAFGATNPFTAGSTVYTVVDTYTSTLPDYGLPQPLGSIYQSPLALGAVGTATKGIGLNGYFKYVRYNPTVSQNFLTGPQLVYWKDNTLTTVTGLASEALSLELIAGWMLFNTTVTPLATGQTAAQQAALVNGNALWIQVGGYLPGAYVTTGTAVGGVIIPASSTFGATGYIAPSTPITDPVAGRVVTVASSNLSDLYIPLIN
jgi:hypothetical protein